MLRFAATGEFVVGGFGSTSAPFAEAYRQIAERGWSLRQHSISNAENEAHVAAFEAVNAGTPIASLRWALEHVFSINANHLARLQTLGAGVTVQRQQYLLGGSGPPSRAIVDSGIRVSAGTDASAISPLSPLSLTLLHGDGDQRLGRTDQLRPADLPDWRPCASIRLAEFVELAEGTARH